MDHIWHQVISVDDNNNPDPENIPFPETTPLKKNGRGGELDTGRNNFPKDIKKFTQHLYCFQKLCSWEGNEDDEVGDVFNFISYWLSKRDTHPQNE